MARHNDPQDNSFGRSLARAVAGGLVALVVTFAVTALLTVVGREDPSEGPAVVAPEASDAQPATQPATQPPAPEKTDAATEAPPSDIGSTAAPEPTDGGTDVPAESITVQVLDAAGSGTHAEDAAAVLRDLGYDVIVVNPTARRVQTTTILATPGFEGAAAELREADERFAEIDENTDFNASVNLHILVGPDFS